MPHLRRYLPPLLMLLPVIFICGKLLLSEKWIGFEIQNLVADEDDEWLHGCAAYDRGWPWTFARAFSDSEYGSQPRSIVATYYFWGSLFADVCVWILPVIATGYLLVRHDRRHGRWPRFSLRSLLLSIAVIAVALGWLLREHQQSKREHRIINQLTQAEPAYRHGYKKFCGPEWVRRLWFNLDGPELFFHITNLSVCDGNVKQLPRSEKVNILRSALSDMPAIKELRVEGFLLLEPIDRSLFSNIEELSIDAFNDVDAEGRILEVIGAFSHLRVLHVDGYNLTDAKLGHLANCTGLESLVIRFDKVTDVGVSHLRRLSRLQHLTLSNPQISDAAMESVAELSSLTDLYLDGTRVSDLGIGKLLALPGLERLHAKGTQITNLGLADCAKMKRLWLLDVSETSIDDAGLEQLSEMSQLRHLDIARTQITDRGIAHLKNLPRLRYLSLDHTQITDTTIESFAQMPSLQGVRWPRFRGHGCI